MSLERKAHGTMEFTHSFTVSTDVDTTWATLTDLEKVAPCLPGAKLEEVDGTVHKGRVRVKVGPVTMTYQGTAELVEADADARRARIDARGREAHGSGTASANIVATLEQTSDSTRVNVVTDLQITGKPAQFGRSVMQDVGTKIINQFAERLETLLAQDWGAADAPRNAPATSNDATSDAPTTDSASVEADNGVSTTSDSSASTMSRITEDKDDDVLDLVGVAGAATAKRVVPLVIGVIVIGVIIWRLASG